MNKRFKKEQAKLVKLVVLITSLADELDEISNFIELKNHKKDIQDLMNDLEVMIDTVYNQKEVQQSTFITELCNKYDYYFDRLSWISELSKNKLFKVLSLLTLIIHDIEQVNPKAELKIAYNKMSELNYVVNSVLVDIYGMDTFERDALIKELNSKFEYVFKKMYRL